MNRKISVDRVRLKRAYEPPSSRGPDANPYRPACGGGKAVKKANATIDEWMKDIAPNTELRK